MTGRIKTLAPVFVAAAAVLASGGVLAVASSASEPSATEDCYATGSPLHCYDGTTLVTATNTTNILLTVGGLTDTCTHSTAAFKPSAAGTGLKKINISPLPVFDNGSGAPCHDNAGGTDSTKTSGKWQIQEKDNDGTAGENAAEPNTGDKILIFVPIDGAVVTNSLGCTITVNPDSTLDPTDGYTKPFKVTGSYDDINTFKVKVSNIPVYVQGTTAACPDRNTAGVHATFSGSYKFNSNITDLS
jgi:hypothetical protein